MSAWFTKVANLRKNREFWNAPAHVFNGLDMARVLLCKRQPRGVQMEKMLLVVLNHREIDYDETSFHLPPAETEIALPRGSACIDPPLDNVLRLLCSGTNELRQDCCECRVTTRLDEAVTLLNQQHFDEVMFDLDVFDGRAHHLVSQLENSSAFLFSRLDVEGASWWLPAKVVSKSKWGAQTRRLKKCDPSLKEIYLQLASEGRRDSSHSSSGIA